MNRPVITPEDLSSKAAARKTLLSLLEPLVPYYSESGARLDIGTTAAHYEFDSIPMEAFARPLWGLAPFWAGGGEAPALEKIYVNGLAVGADPSHPDYWHTCRDFDQKFCEMAAIAYGLLLCPEKLWEPLSPKAKDDLTDWLWEINRHECCACNWQWFCILTNLALKVLGRPYSKERMESGLAMLEDYYENGGWYKDGADGDKDYYNPFVLVSYGLLYAKYMAEEEPERCARFRQRAVEFARDFLYWFSEDGSAVAYGRSMTYRFAQGAFFAIALLTDTPVLPVPVMKGILVRHLCWWLNQPIFDKAGALTIGYGYPNLQMAESYNAPGSPYWAMKTFAFLALPDGHPFWSAPCAPLPELEKLRYLPNAGMLVQRDGSHVVALPRGQVPQENHGHMAEKYGKFAYSSRLGFSVSRSPFSLEEEAPDSMLSFQIGDCCYGRRSGSLEDVVTAEGVLSRWSPFPGIQVETRILPNAQGHLRIHKVTSQIQCRAYDCGFAVSNDDRRSPVRKEAGAAASVRTGDDYCQVVSQSGGQGRVLIPAPNTNVICPKTAIPMAVYDIRPGVQVLETQVNYLKP